MGNTKSQFEQRFSINYGFIQTIDDQYYGKVKIYRKKIQNYHYVIIIDKKLNQFNNRSFITECIRPHQNKSKQMKNKAPEQSSAKLFISSTNNINDQQHYNESIKIQKLKRTFELIKKYQNQQTIPLFSYQLIQGNDIFHIQQINIGNNLQCTQPLIRIYMQYHNHRLFQYLQVLRTKIIQLKISQVIYILISICKVILLLEKMEIQVTVNEINVMTIYTSNQGEIKVNPIEIITKKQYENGKCQEIQNLIRQEELIYIGNEDDNKNNINNNNINNINNINNNNNNINNNNNNNINKHNNQNSDKGYKKSLNYDQTNICSTTTDNYSSISSKLTHHKQILKNILLQLSNYTLIGQSSSINKIKKNYQNISSIIIMADSLQQIIKQFNNYNKNGNIDGLLVERIYDLNQQNNLNNQNNKQLQRLQLQNVINSKYNEQSQRKINRQLNKQISQKQYKKFNSYDNLYYQQNKMLINSKQHKIIIQPQNININMNTNTHLNHINDKNTININNINNININQQNKYKQILQNQSNKTSYHNNNINHTNNINKVINKSHSVSFNNNNNNINNSIFYHQNNKIKMDESFINKSNIIIKPQFIQNNNKNNDNNNVSFNYMKKRNYSGIIQNTQYTHSNNTIVTTINQNNMNNSILPSNRSIHSINTNNVNNQTQTYKKVQQFIVQNQLKQNNIIQQNSRINKINSYSNMMINQQNNIKNNTQIINNNNRNVIVEFNHKGQQKYVQINNNKEFNKISLSSHQNSLNSNKNQSLIQKKSY